MLIVSQNLVNYRMSFPEDTIMRINLAWVNNLEELEHTLSKLDYSIFLDMPIGRSKPPNNNYSLEFLSDIIRDNEKIKYFAISNVEGPEIISEVSELLPDRIIIVPKIETIKAINNINLIAEALRSGERILMLDHDDLFSDIIRKGHTSEYFTECIYNLVNFCETNDLRLLRTRGVIFSDTI